MEAKALHDKILKKSDNALDDAEQIGSAALPLLQEMLSNADGDIRALAMSCLSVIYDDQVPEILIKAIGDADDSVYMSVLQILRSRQLGSSHLPALIDHLNHPDSEVREEVPLLLGKLDNQEAVAPLTKQLGVEDNKSVIRSIKLALARLGSDECKNEFAACLAAEEPDDRLQAVEDLEYINDKNLAKNLLPLLDDQADGYEIGDPDFAEYSRICDSVVNMVSDWYGQAFSFEVDDVKIYGDEEIEEARKFLESLGE